MGNRLDRVRRFSLYLSAAAVLVLISPRAQCSANPDATHYPGGKSTPFRAIINIALADRIPIGIVFGVKQTLCDQEQAYNFTGMSTLQALRRATEGTGYNLISTGGVYELWAPDITQREREVSIFKFSRFSAPPTTVAELGERVTGYVSTVIEGAGGFFLETIGNTSDEIVTTPVMTDLTGPQIADQIVNLGSKGIWMMSAAHSDTEAKPGSTLFRIFSYHDSATTLQHLSCPQFLTSIVVPAR